MCVLSAKNCNMSALYFYYLGINCLTFCVFAWDKRLSKRHRYRISENRLLTLAGIGGALGALLAISFCRHKTKHLKFILLIPLCLLVHTAIIILLYYNLL